MPPVAVVVAGDVANAKLMQDDDAVVVVVPLDVVVGVSNKGSATTLDM